MCGFWGPNSGHQVCTASAFTCEVIPLAYGRNLERLSPLVFLDSAISSTGQLLLTLEGRGECESWMELSGPGCAGSHPSTVGETAGLVFPACWLIISARHFHKTLTGIEPSNLQAFNF